MRDNGNGGGAERYRRKASAIEMSENSFFEVDEIAMADRKTSPVRSNIEFIENAIVN